VITDRGEPVAELKPLPAAGGEDAKLERLSRGLAGDRAARAGAPGGGAAIKDAHLPRVKTLEDFDFRQAAHLPAARIRELAEGGCIERAEPVIFIGECGTGKTHLLTGYASRRAGRNAGSASRPRPPW
jgi:antitoxin (DNA-binding transcriptional repressor) of toxin-antitoxin stability system